MNKRFLFLIFTLIISFPLFAQLEVKEGSFKKVDGFVNINTDKMYDDNDKPYAVLKIRTEGIDDKQRHELVFGSDQGTSFEVEYKIGEVWLYISYYTSYVKISHPQYGTIRFDFPSEMKGKEGYEMTITNTSSNDVGFGALKLTTTPENDATISLNGSVLTQKTPYFNNMMTSGEYEITVSKPGFQSVTKTVVVDHDGSVDLEIEMPYLYGKIEIETKPSEARVFIDDKELGVTPIVLDSIRTGRHKLVLQKGDCQTLTKFFLLDEENDLKFDEQLEHRPEGSLTGVFSVSPTKKVLFSKGNLKYTVLTKIWSFEEKQWRGGDCSDYYVELFGWGTGDNPTKWSSNPNNYKTFVDWGVNTISNGGNTPNIWHTLTEKEWEYVKNRPGKSVYAKVADHVGLILLPDNWDDSNYKFIDNITKKESKQVGWVDETKYIKITKIISEEDWFKYLEPNGAVFLPATGYRIGRDCSTYRNGSKGYNKSINDYHGSTIKDPMKSYEGRSVRLVWTVEE